MGLFLVGSNLSLMMQLYLFCCERNATLIMTIRIFAPRMPVLASYYVLIVKECTGSKNTIYSLMVIIQKSAA